MARIEETAQRWKLLSMQTLCCLLVATAILILMTAGRLSRQSRSDSIFVSDQFGYYMYLPSLVIDRDLEFGNELARQPDQANHTFYQIVPKTGRPGNPFQVGSAMLWAPFFLAAHGGVTLAKKLGVNVSPDGFGYEYELPVLFGTLLISIVGIWYIYRLLVKLHSHSVAVIAAGCIALGTPLSAYIWIEPGMSKGCSMCLIAMLFYYLHEASEHSSCDWKTWARLGAICGLIAAVRATDVFAALPVAILGISLAFGVGGKESRFRQALPAVAAFLSAGFFCFSPQLIVWNYLYGAPFVIPQGTNYEQQSWFQPDVVAYLFSSRRGVFSWSPVWTLSALGLIYGAIVGHRYCLQSLLVLFVAVYFTSSTPNWWVGCNFGEARMVDYSVFFAIGLAFFLTVMFKSVMLRPLAVILVLLIVFNWTLMLRYYMHDLPEYGYVSFKNLYIGTFSFPLRLLSKMI